MNDVAPKHDRSHEHGHRHMLWMMLACVAVGIAGYFVGGLDYLWVGLMGSCLAMHLMHTLRKGKHDREPEAAE